MEKQENYFALSIDDDGEFFVEAFTKERLENAIKSDWWGDDIKFLDRIPTDGTMTWGNGIVIIKGNIITPKEVKVIVEWSIE